MAPRTFSHPNVRANCSFLSTPFWIDKTLATWRCLTLARAADHIIRLDRHNERIGCVNLLGVSDHSDRYSKVHQACNSRPVFLQVRGALTTSEQRDVFPSSC